MFIFDEIDNEVGACVYKLWYGDRFIIVKGKTLAGSIFLIEKGFAYFISGGGGSGKTATGEGHKEWDGKNTFYYQFYKWVKENPQYKPVIEIILESENGYDLLVCEQKLIDENIRNKKCLNSNVEAYVPKYREKTQSYGWISKAHYLNFKKHMKQC